MSGFVRRIVASAIVLAAGAAPAVVFSPGPLASPHANLEGLANCTQCHVKGAQLSPTTCLACHTELKDRVAEHRGFHGRLAPSALECNKCHHEHQGTSFRLVDWGASGQKGFDHRKTGFPLLGKHAPVACDQCHNDRLIQDAAIRALRAKEPQRTTFLGTAVQCSGCHFDDHRGQLGAACKNCHNESGWKPAPGFNHRKTRYPLAGKHVAVQCQKCHAPTMDADAHKGATLRPRSEVFSRFRPVAHGSCVDCHKDPHEGRLGDNCARCHSVAGWMEMRGAGGERAFHEKTRYPLRGTHVEVACKSCHGPFPGAKATYKGLAFDSCATCHVDAHLSQLGQLGTPAAACDRCHTVSGFRPARYEVQDHVGWPLLGAHEAVACVRCHPAEPKLAARAVPVRAWIEKRGRKDEVSLAQFHPPGDNSRCDACHADQHKGQFQKRVRQAGCTDCHQVASWTDVRFDHDRETRFPLTGGHGGRACASCHAPDAGGVVRYAGVATACASCHADAHAGQFAPARGGATECARCHSTGAWAPTSFEHRPPFTSFELQGKHASVACAGCHRGVAVAAGMLTVRYRGIPTSCEGCHVDVHRGAFREFTP
jgi:hypothetical protein